MNEGEETESKTHEGAKVWTGEKFLFFLSFSLLLLLLFFTVARVQFSHPRVDLWSSVRELRSFHFLFRAVFCFLFDPKCTVVSRVVRDSALRVVGRFRGAVIVVVLLLVVLVVFVLVVVLVSRWTGAHLPHAATAAVAVTGAGRARSLARSRGLRGRGRLFSRRRTPRDSISSVGNVRCHFKSL